MIKTAYGLAGLGKFALCSAIALAPCILSGQNSPTLTIRNNHDIPFAGAIEVAAGLPDGNYRQGNSIARVTGGVARAYLSLKAKDSVRLRRVSDDAPVVAHGAFAVSPGPSAITLRWNGVEIGRLELGLAFSSGATGSVEDAVRSFQPLAIAWTTDSDGVLRGITRGDGYEIRFSAISFGGGTLDLKSRVTRTGPTGGTAYLALIRRLTTARVSDERLRFNGREFSGGDSPTLWDRDFWYTRGVDWSRWRSGRLSFLSVNGFTPAPTTLRDSVWAVGSHFYVWEKTRQRGDTMYLVSEIAGPNPDQAKSGYMGVTPYAAFPQGDTVSLKSRIAVSASPDKGWEESQLRVFAGYRASTGTGSNVSVDLGVKSVVFGTSYFPYSTLAENFDYYRTPGLSSENFWPVSTVMWAGWRNYVPRMRTDLHIIRAMGFEVVRLHHLELLTGMERNEALAFLDFFIGQTRELGMHVMIDTEGPPDWVRTLASRYRGTVTRFELENENLIPGIRPSQPDRWRALYAAAKSGAPGAQVFLTGAGNNGMFERLRSLGVPFDRVGLHAYKHGPQWKEAYSSHVLGSSGYATDIGKPMTLGEFNWKDLTRMPPEMRVGEVATIYETVLAPRAIPEFFEFQFQESLTFNPSVAGSNSRHYETLALDRRPKPEAAVLMRAIREYGRPDAAVSRLPVSIGETQFSGDQATASFTVTNRTSHTVRLRLRAVAYDGLMSTLLSPGTATLRPGSSLSGRIGLALLGDMRVGTYHHFLDVSFDGKHSYGWGVASKRGAPEFGPTVLGDRVFYPQGAEVVGRADWSRSLTVAFGATASVLELESAYQLATTLQSATGRAVRISSVADIPDSISKNGLVILVGTPASNSLISAADISRAVSARPGTGIITLGESNGVQVLMLSGENPKAVQAAVVELELRYWPGAKDATMRITGMEKGAALGHRAGGAAVDPP